MGHCPTNLYTNPYTDLHPDTGTVHPVTYAHLSSNTRAFHADFDPYPNTHIYPYFGAIYTHSYSNTDTHSHPTLCPYTPTDAVHPITYAHLPSNTRAFHADFDPYPNTHIYPYFGAIYTYPNTYPYPNTLLSFCYIQPYTHLHTDTYAGYTNPHSDIDITDGHGYLNYRIDHSHLHLDAFSNRHSDAHDTHPHENTDHYRAGNPHPHLDAFSNRHSDAHGAHPHGNTDHHRAGNPHPHLDTHSNRHSDAHDAHPHGNTDPRSPYQHTNTYADAYAEIVPN